MVETILYNTTVARLTKTTIPRPRRIDSEGLDIERQFRHAGLCRKFLQFLSDNAPNLKNSASGSEFATSLTGEYSRGERLMSLSTKILAAAAGAMLLGTGAANAAVLAQVNADLLTPVGPPAGTAGWYSGSSPNPNGGFTINNIEDHDNIEVGLRVKLRQTPTVISSPDNHYDVPNGPQRIPINSQNAANRATWNYEFSVNLRADGGSLDLNDVKIVLTVAKNGVFSPLNIDPLTFWVDNEFIGNGINVVASAGNQPDLDTVFGFQQSQNPTFGQFPFNMPAGSFDFNALDDYTFRLEVFDLQNLLLAAAEIDVSVVPEPGTLALMGAGLLGLSWARRRRRA